VGLDFLFLFFVLFMLSNGRNCRSAPGVVLVVRIAQAATHRKVPSRIIDELYAT
jgi:hypothetical protein